MASKNICLRCYIGWRESGCCLITPFLRSPKYRRPLFQRFLYSPSLVLFHSLFLLQIITLHFASPRHITQTLVPFKSLSEDMFSPGSSPTAVTALHLGQGFNLERTRLHFDGRQSHQRFGPHNVRFGDQTVQSAKRPGQRTLASGKPWWENEKKKRIDSDSMILATSKMSLRPVEIKAGRSPPRPGGKGVIIVGIVGLQQSIAGSATPKFY